MSKLHHRLDQELLDITLSPELRSRVLARASSPLSRLLRLLNREIEIPMVPALALCMAVVIAGSAWAGRLAVGQAEVQSSQYQMISMERGREPDE